MSEEIPYHPSRETVRLIRRPYKPNPELVRRVAEQTRNIVMSGTTRSSRIDELESLNPQDVINFCKKNWSNLHKLNANTQRLVETVVNARLVDIPEDEIATYINKWKEKAILDLLKTKTRNRRSGSVEGQVLTEAKEQPEGQPEEPKKKRRGRSKKEREIDLDEGNRG